MCDNTKTVTIKWNITWDNAAKIFTLLPTITSTTTSVKKPLSNEAVIGAFVGALSGVLITIAVVAIYNKRKSKGKKPHTPITTVPSTYKELSVTRTGDHNYECVDNSQKHGINQIRVSQSEDQDGYEIPITSTYM
ncbi:hypothetical protein EB796_014921 [Bugula neritina]|uniref:Uncharacterized protein n=1 Tax=Bugula neritina TaxID=10212 RepID=A0A7J7JLL9_BUGNE|nr:hypothetical protein EB796_014921 [Bugula neritina]